MGQELSNEVAVLPSDPQGGGNDGGSHASSQASCCCAVVDKVSKIAPSSDDTAPFKTLPEAAAIAVTSTGRLLVTSLLVSVAPILGLLAMACAIYGADLQPRHSEFVECGKLAAPGLVVLFFGVMAACLNAFESQSCGWAFFRTLGANLAISMPIVGVIILSNARSWIAEFGLVTLGVILMHILRNWIILQWRALRQRTYVSDQAWGEQRPKEPSSISMCKVLKAAPGSIMFIAIFAMTFCLHQAMDGMSNLGARVGVFMVAMSFKVLVVTWLVRRFRVGKTPQHLADITFFVIEMALGLVIRMSLLTDLIPTTGLGMAVWLCGLLAAWCVTAHLGSVWLFLTLGGRSSSLNYIHVQRLQGDMVVDLVSLVVANFAVSLFSHGGFRFPVARVADERVIVTLAQVGFEVVGNAVCTLVDGYVGLDVERFWCSQCNRYLLAFKATAALWNAMLVLWLARVRLGRCY